VGLTQCVCRARIAAWATFLRAARLTKQALLDNASLVDKLARQHVVPHVRARQLRSAAVCRVFAAVAHAHAPSRQVALRTIDFTPGEVLTTLSQEARSCAIFALLVHGSTQRQRAMMRRTRVAPDVRCTCAQTLVVRPTAGVYVVVSARSSALITVPDIEAKRSVMHVIDGVLIPRSVNPQT
jgi:hypothetical protein